MSNPTRRFWIGGTQISVTKCGDGRVCVRSIHPYDETAYHWACHDGTEDGCWQIFLDGKPVAHSRDYYDGAVVSPEDIAHELLNLDRLAGLERRGGIW